MANWYQRKPALDAKLAMLLRFGQTDIVIAALELAQARCEADDDVVPSSVEPHLAKLVELGLAPSTSETLHFLRQKRRHRGGTTKNHVAPGGTTENHGEPDKKREEKKREEKRERKPRAERTAKPSLETWSPNDSHRELAKQRGVDVEREAAKMRDWLLANGKRYKDYDAGFRNWLERARPEPVGRPTLVRPNLSNNLLQHDNHPEGAGEEYWLQGIEKYKYGGTNG
jgi:hypothetical protein